ncbi:hypothetical protein [Arthrobacter sp. NPDC090010]|uniref:hypothetical protein n=1 Tax=Arthrobacter sp. NPDC090010 TaxID=3363942 RepID=UPI0037F43487
MSHDRQAAMWQGSLFVVLGVITALSNVAVPWKVSLVALSLVVAILVVTYWVRRDRRDSSR